MPVKPPAPKNARPVVIPPTVGKVDPTAAIRAAEVSKLRADFRPEVFVRMIRQKGYFMRWRKAILCTCVRKETDQPRLDCTVCDQSGFFYIDPHEIQAIITEMSRTDSIYKHVGQWSSGNSRITVEPQYRLGYRDSLEMVDSLMPFNEWIVKGNRHGTRIRLPDNHDAARYKIVNVTGLFREVGGKPVRLTEGVHFEISKEGWIHWLQEGRKIKDETTLSIHYDFHPVWMVLSHMHSVRDTVTEFKRAGPTVEALPVQVEAGLDYIVSSDTIPPTTAVV